MFIPLHIHSDFSLLESCIRIKDLVETAARYGYPYLALTDHNTTGGLIEFYQRCQEHQITPILGMDIDVTGFRGLNKVVLLAEDQTGYRNLLYLSSLPKPLAKEALVQHSSGLICLVYLQNLETANVEYQEFVKIYGSTNVYIELLINSDHQRNHANQLVKLFPQEILVASDVINYLTEEQRPVLQVLHALKANVSIEEVKISGQPLLSPKQAKEAFHNVPAALSNTKKIAKRCQVALVQETSFPKLPHSVDLTDLAIQGAKKRYHELSLRIRERLDYELTVIKEMGFTDYFLIVQDIVNYAKKTNIPVGPGRGSAAGSLVAYCLGITDIDPLEHNLFFERFLNKQRKNLPDIDLDFCHKGREKVMDYVFQRFGKEHVARIGAYGTFGSSLATREVNKLVKEQRLAQSIIQQLIGLKHHFTTHAAGLIITSEPILHYSAVEPHVNQPVSQADMNSLADLGVLKIDLLSLRNLTILNEIQQSIQVREADFSLENIPVADQKTFQLLSQGETLGVFQLESSLFQELLPQIQPKCFADLVALLALGRPGPLKQVPTYVKRREQREQVVYLHPLLEPILAETYGLILYQEQVMQVAHELAGFRLEEADLLRVAMSKKDHDLIQKLKSKFIIGCQEQGLSVSSSHKLFNQISSFADYAFNKAHSTAYALITWRTAYLKANYPLDFYLAHLKNTGSIEKNGEFFAESFARSIAILGPDIRYSEIDFTKEGQSIRIGLASLKYVGRAVAEQISAERHKVQFSSINDFLNRVPLTLQVATSLAYAGGFDGFAPRARAVEEIITYFQGKVTEHTDLELLEREKEIVGLYLSGHPLYKWENFLDNLKDSLGHCLAGHVLETSDKYSTITGKIAGSRKTYQFTMNKNDYLPFLKKGELLALFGKNTNNYFQVELVLPLKPMLILQPIMEKVNELQELLAKHQGTTPVLLSITEGSLQLISPRFWLIINNEVLAKLKELCIHIQWIDPWREYSK